MEDGHRSGRTCTSKTDENVTKVRDLVRSDRRLTVRMISSVLNLNRQTVHEILTFEMGMRTLRCHITTILPVTLSSSWTNFWPKKVFQWFRSHHTRLIWVRVTSSFSQNSNSTLKVVFLELWTTSKRSWQTSRGHFYMKTSRTATGSGSKVSGGVWLPKGTTLKGIMLIYR